MSFVFKNSLILHVESYVKLSSGHLIQLFFVVASAIFSRCLRSAMRSITSLRKQCLVRFTSFKIHVVIGMRVFFCWDDGWMVIYMYGNVTWRNMHSRRTSNRRSAQILHLRPLEDLPMSHAMDSTRYVRTTGRPELIAAERSQWYHFSPLAPYVIHELSSTEPVCRGSRGHAYPSSGLIKCVIFHTTGQCKECSS